MSTESLSAAHLPSGPRGTVPGELVLHGREYTRNGQPLLSASEDRAPHDDGQCVCRTFVRVGQACEGVRTTSMRPVGIASRVVQVALVTIRRPVLVRAGRSGVGLAILFAHTWSIRVRVLRLLRSKARVKAVVIVDVVMAPSPDGACFGASASVNGTLVGTVIILFSVGTSVRRRCIHVALAIVVVWGEHSAAGTHAVFSPRDRDRRGARG